MNDIVVNSNVLHNSIYNTNSPFLKTISSTILTLMDIDSDNADIYTLEVKLKEIRLILYF